MSKNKRKLKTEDLHFVKSEALFNENQEPELYNMKEHLSKLKFNFGEVESKKRFLEALKTLDKSVKIDLDPDYDELKSRKDLLKQQKKVTTDQKDKIRDLLRDVMEST